MITEEYDFLVDQYDNIDQSEIYNIVDNNRLKRNEDWIIRFRKETVSSDDKYISQYYDLKKMRVDPKFKSSAPELKSWVYKFINNFPDLLNLNDIKKRAVKKVGISQIRNEIKNFEELRDELDDNIKGDTAVLDTFNDIKRELNKEVEKIFPKSVIALFQDSWVRQQNSKHLRTFVIKTGNEIKKNSTRLNIIKLQSIIDKYIELEYQNDNNQKQREFFKNNSERLKGHFEGLDLFNKINQDKIKISIDKKVLNWAFNFKISHTNNFPRIALDVFVQTFNQISFGKTANVIPKRLISYKEARDDFIKKITDDLQAQFKDILSQGSIKVLQGKSR